MKAYKTSGKGPRVVADIAQGLLYEARQEAPTVTYYGKTYDVDMAIPVRRELASLAAQLGLNPASSDIRYFEWSPVDFPSASAYPQEGSVFTLSEGGIIKTFEIARVSIGVLEGVDIAIHTMAFRKPLSDAQATGETAGEPNPGQSANVDMWPPANPQND